ncbi:MAG: hypothetical protein B6D45_06480, partial [Ignavibacteriales bacterium UTCHB3]
MIGVLLGLPLTIILVLNLFNLFDSIDFVDKEKTGIKIFIPLTSLQVHLMEHKAYSFATISSGVDYQTKIAALNSQIKDELDQLIKINNTEGKNIGVDNETMNLGEDYYLSPPSLMAQWEKLLSESKRLSPGDLLTAYNKLEDNLGKFMRLVTVNARLTLDPSGDAYHLIYLSIHLMPRMHDLIGRAFIVAIEDAQDSLFNNERLAEIIYLTRTMRNLITDEIPSAVRSAIDLDPEYNGRLPSIDGVLSPMLEHYRSDVISILEIYENIIRNNSTYGTEELTGLTTEKLDESLDFNRAALNELEKVVHINYNYTYYRIFFRFIISVGAFLLAMVMIYFTAKGMITPVNGVAEIARDLSEGDIQSAKEKVFALAERFLVSPIGAKKEKDEIWKLFRAIHGTIDNLEIILRQVGRAGIAVTSSVTQISASVQALNAAINQQAASTAEVKATGKEIYSSSIQLSETVEDVAEKSGRTLQLADKGASGLTEINLSMASLEQGSKEIAEKLSELYKKTSNITNVITTITKIATQTNLLSLNASIEAEKAGEYGAGFSVVSAEIKRLAEETAMAALEIEETIREMQQAVKADVIGVEVYAGTTRSSVSRISGIADNINEIIEYTKGVLPSFEEVSTKMKIQTDGAAQISDAMSELNDVALHTRESISEFSEITENLEGAVG